MAPAQSFVDTSSANGQVVQGAFISPFTTLVTHEVVFNEQTLTQAREKVKATYGLTADPMSNFIADGNTNMALKAQVLTVALGQAKQSAIAELTGAPAKDVQSVIAQSVGQTAPVLVTDSALPQNQSTLTAKLKTEVSNKAGKLGKEQAQNKSTSATTSYNFVVVFKSSVTDPASQGNQIGAAHGGNVTFRYTRALKGFAVSLPAAAVTAFLEAMDNNPNVDYVEADGVFQRHVVTETTAAWGLDRIDQLAGLNTTYTYNETGTGVRAYVVDTGILATHADFGGRVLSGYSAISDGYGTSDCNGHGTHVAGTIGSGTYGVAKAVNLVPVRVLDCTGSGSLSGVIAGLDWVVTNAVKPAVVNMSLGGGVSTSLDTAVSNTINSGIQVVVAAGNSGADACLSSPARVPSALTVGATTNTDARASYSNFGSCLDVFAPGSGITSVWNTSVSATNTISGTSMASPHVAGVLALALQSNGNATPAELSNIIKTQSTSSVLTGTGSGSPNLLLYSLLSSSSSVPPPPVVSVSLAGLEGSAVSTRQGWQAIVKVTVKNASGVLVSGATVSGGFTLGGSSVSCTTNAGGYCTMASGVIGRKKGSQTTFSVSGISGASMQYSASGNTASSTITVTQPN